MDFTEKLSFSSIETKNHVINSIKDLFKAGVLNPAKLKEDMDNIIIINAVETDFVSAFNSDYQTINSSKLEKAQQAVIKKIEKK